MAGRRLRAAVKQVLVEGNVVGADQEVYVTIAGLANNYASYVTTFEEYQAQRYEAASTIYGPHTLDGTAWDNMTILCMCKIASLS
jgi:neutral ceramidase